MSAPPPDQEDMICRLCQHRGSDVQFKGCGCTLHARCVPLSMIIGEGNPQQPLQEGVPPPIQNNSLPCEVCKQGVMTGMYLFPLSLNLLDRAVELRKKVARAAARASTAATNANGKRQRELDSDFHEVQAESSYLLLSHGRSSLTSTMSMETELHRTGRWTPEEIAFVDFLLNTFDRSLLTLPHGIKLNEFLGDVLLCKSSRLTKKMKNARLSTRSYALRPPMPNGERLDVVAMSQLQQKFAHSLSNESTQLELLFNLTKLWRTHFSNLCLQVGYSFLDAADWVSSLEAMERRASEAEEMIRKARRKRMGLALRTDARSSNPGVFFANRPVQGIVPAPPPAPVAVVPNTAQSSLALVPNGAINKNMFDSDKNVVSNDDAADADFISHMLELSSQPGPDGQRNRLLSMDLGNGGLEDFLEPNDPAGSKPGKTFEHGAFLQELVAFLEKHHLPFVHLDMWCPSVLLEKKDGSSEGGQAQPANDEIRLYHAGSATRQDVSPMVAAQFNEFGEYSKKFSFAPGVGLPGRVFDSGKPCWSTRVDQADPKFFERAGGAKVYGVKTVLGVPVTSSIGKLVVAMYTMADLQRNEAVIEKCVAGFSNYTPEPKWRLVVEMGTKGRAANDTTGTNSSAGTGDFDFRTCFDGDDYGGPSSAPKSVVATHEGENRSVAVAASTPGTSVADDEQKIATLLGEYMPLSNMMPSTTGAGSPDFLNEFMQLRLLLLRPRGRRPPGDNELIDILLKSFHGYSTGNRRTGSELATLLVNDWRFLKGSAMPSQAPPTPVVETKLHPMTQAAMTSQPGVSPHQCHVMNAPNFNTYASSAASTRRPSQLAGLGHPPMITQSGGMDPMRASFDGGGLGPAALPTTQRRISISSEVPDSPRSNQVNVVNP